MKKTPVKKPMGAIAKTKEEINTKVQAVLSDKKHLNNILELLDNVNAVKVNSDEISKLELARATTSLHGLVDIMKHLILQGNLDKQQTEDNAVKLQVWVQEKLDILWKSMLEFMVGPDMKGSLGEFSVVGAFTIIRALYQRRAQNAEEELDHWSGEEVKLLRSLLPGLCSSTKCCQKKIRRFQEFTDYIDVKQHIIQGLSKFVKQFAKKSDGKEAPTQHLKNNIMCMLEIIKFTKPKDLSNLNTFLGQEDESATSHFKFTYEPVQKAFSELWESFLKFPLDSQLYKRVLILMNDQVLPHLTRPLLLTDFLIDSYNVGGAISVLALNGVFTLIQKYNLEYPDFYIKLYHLFQPEILAAKYRARFFYLADIFLTSSHLPEYLVAAFVKRLSRLALTAPADSLLMVFPFIGNLLLRHPGLLKMIRGRDDDSSLEQAEDPYLMSEPDPSKCRAVESSLWEILTLQKHVLPQIAQNAKFISKKLPEMEWDLSEFLELGMVDMMQVETKKKIFVNVPLNFERPAGLKFAKNDVTSKYFSAT